MNFLKILFVGILLMLIGACSTITITAKDTPKIRTRATYQKGLNFFLGGLVGTAEIDAQSVCKDKKIVQIQTFDSFMNRFLTGISFFIYSPRTLRIWCEEKGSAT